MIQNIVLPYHLLTSSIHLEWNHTNIMRMIEFAQQKAHLVVRWTFLYGINTSLNHKYRSKNLFESFFDSVSYTFLSDLSLNSR